jgi:hypothetical protein
LQDLVRQSGFSGDTYETRVRAAALHRALTRALSA